MMHLTWSAVPHRKTVSGSLLGMSFISDVYARRWTLSTLWTRLRSGHALCESQAFLVSHP